MPEFDHSDLPDPHEALTSRRAAHGRVLDAQQNALRAQAQVDAEQVAQQRFEMQRQTLELNRVKALSDIARQSALVRQQMTAQEHTANALEALGGISPSDAGYPLKMAEVFKNNPMAAQDPVVQAVVRSHIASRQVAETSASHVEQIKSDEATRLAAWRARRADEDAAAKALRDAPENSGMTPEQMTARGAGGSVTLRADRTPPVKTHLGAEIDAAKIAASPDAQYGTYNNKVFTPVAAGTPDVNPTHVQIIYQHPTKGTDTEILPRAEYETQMNARKAASPAPAAAPTTPAATVKWTRDADGNPVPVK